MAESCLDEATIAALLDGGLADDRAALVEIENHADRCPGCRGLLVHLARDAAPRPAQTAPFGRFVVVERIGAGAMGTVYSAHDPNLDRKIALKLLTLSPADAASSARRARFVREAKTMARLSHPNVVQVFEVGNVGEQLFIAMELVEGTTVRTRDRAAAWHWREVVSLFIQAGRGLAAAHAAGIIHRDFKPENVLVGSDGRVRVGDFGLSSWAAESVASLAPTDDPLTITRTGTMVGTPAYMSPEQLAGEAGDACSDQFSFCIALFESLYGERPFAGNDVEALAAAMAAGAVREPTGRKVPRRLRAIVLRGLAKDPGQRFPSVAALVSQLERELSRRPRRWALLAAAVVLASFALVLIRPGQRARLCAGGADRLVGVWDPAARARVRRALAGANKPYVREMLPIVEAALEGYAHGWAAMDTEACAATRVRGEQSDELLTLRGACLERKKQALGAVVEVLAEGRPEVLERSIQLTESLEPIADCGNIAALTQRVRPPADPTLARKVTALEAELARSRALVEAGQYDRAESLARTAVQAARALPYRPVLAQSLFQLARVRFDGAHAADGKELAREALWAAQAAGDDETVAHACIKLMGQAAFDRDPLQRTWHECAVATLERLGKPTLLMAHFLDKEANELDRAGDVEGALAERKRAIALFEKTGDTLGLARILVVTATQMHGQGKGIEAGPYLERALQIAEHRGGSSHPLVAKVLNARVLIAYDQQRYQAALADLKRAETISEAALGPDSKELADSLNRAAWVLSDLGRFDEAIAAGRRALAIIENIQGREGIDVATTLSSIGHLFIQRKQYAQALPYLERSFSIYRKKVALDHPDAAMTLVEIGEAQVGIGKIDRALGTLTQATALCSRHPEDAGNLGTSQFELAKALAAHGERERARRTAEQALANTRKDPAGAEGVAAIENWLKTTTEARSAPAEPASANPHL